MPRTDALVHPTAVISADARLAADVRVGPYAIIDGPVSLGEGCVVGPHAHLTGTVIAGPNNHFGTGCVIGERPQHLGYKGEPTRVEIGEGNQFREHVTVHRGMPNAAGVTRVGNDNLFMVNSHIAHDCQVGSNCIFANGAVIGGHVTVGDRVLLSGNSGVHQFCRVGRLALLSGLSALSQDLPPFWIAQGVMNLVNGINVIGMRRAGMPTAEIQAVRRAFRTIHLQGLTVSEGVTRVEREIGQSPAVREVIEFIRTSKRGIAAGLARDFDMRSFGDSHGDTSIRGAA